MSDKKDRIEILASLSEQRKVDRNQITQNINNLRSSLKPVNLLSRATHSAKGNVQMVGEKAAKTARSYPTATATVGGTILAAILYKPIGNLIGYIQNTGKNGYAEIDHSDSEED